MPIPGGRIPGGTGGTGSAGNGGSRGNGSGTGTGSSTGTGGSLKPAGTGRVPGTPKGTTGGGPKGTTFGGVPGEAQKSLDTMLSEIAEGQLQYSLHRARDFVTQGYLSQLNPGTITTAGGMQNCQLKAFIPGADVALYRLCSLYYDENESIYEKITSVYTAMNMLNAGVAVILHGTRSGCDVFMAVSTVIREQQSVLVDSLQGMFPGSVFMREPSGRRVSDIIGKGCNFIQSVAFTPARRQAEVSRETIYSAQGLEKIVEALRGREYTVVLLATGMSQDMLQQRSSGLEMLSTMISSFEKEARTITDSDNQSTSLSNAKTLSDSLSETLSKSYGTSHGDSSTKGRSKSHGHTTSFFGVGFNSGSGDSDAVTVSDGTTSGTSEAWGKVHATGVSEGYVTSSGTSRSVATNYSRENKTVHRIQNLIDAQLQRLDVGISRGMWECACYVCARDIATVMSASGVVASTLSGDSSQPLPVFRNLWTVATAPGEADAVSQVIRYLSDLQHPVFEIGAPDERIEITPAVMVNGLEIGVFLPLPRKSLPSVSVRTMAEFARNISYMDDSRLTQAPDFRFGNVVHMHHDENIQLPFYRDLFSSHVFITGSSGSGKSNTTYALLEKLCQDNVHFLVIEPVKGDYKKKMGSFPGTQVFTTITDSYRTLRINPFAFPEQSIKISAHIDRLRDTVCACWPLYGPMPGMLKQAFEMAYRECGWDLKLSERVVDTGHKYPTFADLARATEKVIHNAGYSANNESDYRGALLVRITSLMSGIERDVFVDEDCVSDQELFDRNAIVDLSHVGSPESLSLIMGILVIKLREYRMSKATGADEPTRHVTVLEEAHNLLQRCSTEVGQESANSQGKAVGEIVKCIAEMRTYGESFVIVDQSPSTVDPAAMRNTAIKVVMRLQDSNDIQAVADAMALSDEQAREVSRLSRGIAVVNQSEWLEPVMGRMGGAWKSPYAALACKPCSKEALMHVRSMVAAFMFWCYSNNKLTPSSISELGDILDEVASEREYEGINLGYRTELMRRCEHFQAAYTQMGNTNKKDKRAWQIHMMADFLVSLLLMEDMVHHLPRLVKRDAKKTKEKSKEGISTESVIPAPSPMAIKKWRSKFLDVLYNNYVRPYEYNERMGTVSRLNSVTGQAQELREFLMWCVADLHEREEKLTGRELIKNLGIKTPA